MSWGSEIMKLTFVLCKGVRVLREQIRGGQKNVDCVYKSLAGDCVTEGSPPARGGCWVEAQYEVDQETEYTKGSFAVQPKSLYIAKLHG